MFSVHQVPSSAKDTQGVELESKAGTLQCGP
jgi:hypothetical protein